MKKNKFWENVKESFAYHMGGCLYRLMAVGIIILIVLIILFIITKG